MAASKKGVSGTKEWSSSSVNCMDGCSNDCLYCYAKATAISRLKRSTPETWKDEKPRKPKGYGKREGTIMFPTTHDLTLGNIGHCERVAADLLAALNRLLIVSKPRPDVIERLCKRMADVNPDARKRVLFRFTIGSTDSRALRFWEPNAPSYEQRLYSLMWCHKNGWQTSVSMEPLLEIEWDAVQRQVEALSPYVTDAIWIGKMNKPGHRLSINHGGIIPPEVQQRSQALVMSQSDARILDLYARLKDHPAVKWKESIKKIVGIEVPTEAGLDI
jgi:DNA repair photolyase